MARVLVVDDDTTVREVVVSYLRAAGHDVEEAGDGESGQCDGEGCGATHESSVWAIGRGGRVAVALSHLRRPRG